jgi:hypothetical protein
MNDQYEHIHNATNERLAEMLEPICFDIALNNPEAVAILGEVCRRLRTKHKEPFNNEAFE